VALTLSLAASGAQAFTVLGVFHLRGPQAPYDAPALQGLKLALQDFNASGGLAGDKASLRLLDPSEPTSTLKTGGSGVSAVLLGPALEVDEVLKVGAATAPGGAPLVLAGQGSVRLTGQLSNRVFLANFGDNVQAGAAAQFALKKNWGSVLILGGGSQVSQDLVRYFRDAFFKSGGRLAVAQRYGGAGGAYEDPESLRILKATLGSVQAIYLAVSSEDAGRIVRNLRLGGVLTPIFGPDRLEFSLPGSLSEAQLGEVYATSHAYFSMGASAPLRAFALRYQVQYAGQLPGSFAAVGFDAGNLLFAAVRSSRSSKAAAVARALASIKNLDGITGNLVFAAASRVPQSGVLVVRVTSAGPVLAAASQLGYVPDP